SVDTHTPGLRSICPETSAMNAATASWRTRMNSIPTCRAASMKARISPPGRPYIRSTPASRSVAARTSAHVGMIRIVRGSWFVVRGSSGPLNDERRTIGDEAEPRTTDHYNPAVYPFADLELARRLERAEGLANARCVEARARVAPEVGATWISVAGAMAMFC